MESPQAVSIFGSDESEDDAESPRSISLIEFSSSSSSLTSTTSTQATTPYSYMEGSPNNRLNMNLINSFGSIDDDDDDDLSLSFPLPAGLLEMPPFFHPTWSISEYGELNGDDHVRNYPRFYMFGDTMMDLAFKSSDKIGFGWLLRSAYEGKVEIVNRVNPRCHVFFFINLTFKLTLISDRDFSGERLILVPVCFFI